MKNKIPKHQVYLHQVLKMIAIPREDILHAAFHVVQSLEIALFSHDLICPSFYKIKIMSSYDIIWIIVNKQNVQIEYN